MSRLFIIIPLRKGVRECGKIELPLTGAIAKYLAEFLLCEVHIGDNRLILVKPRDLSHDRYIAIITSDEIEDFQSFYVSLENSLQMLKQLEPYDELVNVVYLTDSVEKFWNVTKFKGDPEVRRGLTDSETVDIQVDGYEAIIEVMMGLSRLGAVVKEKIDLLEISALLVATAVATTYLAWRLLDANRELDGWIKKLKGLTYEDYDKLADKIVELSKVASDYVFLRLTSSELCTRLILKYRTVNGLDNIWKTTIMKLDILKDYISAKLNLKATTTSTEILNKLETMNSMSSALSNVMNLINILAAASISLGFSENLSEILPISSLAISRIYWGIVLFALTFTTLYLLKGELERSSLPIIRKSYDWREISQLMDKNCRPLKFEKILEESSESRHIVIWQRGKVRITTALNPDGEITRIHYEKNGRGDSEERDLCGFLTWLKSSGMLNREGRIHRF